VKRNFGNFPKGSRGSLTEHAATLQATLDEEKHADQLLSQISQRANRDASTVAA
jgi:hypothetical protein